MAIRRIVQIDEALCDGCGNCIPNCAEGALKIVDGKARIIKDVYCDGLGACLGHCPQGAISIIEREAAPFDLNAVQDHLRIKEETDSREKRSVLGQWPVQLNLVPVKAPFYEDADLLVVADCVPVAYPNLHNTLLKGKKIVIGCPKFDNVKVYVDKLSEILRQNDIKSITLAHMEVPCCSGLNWVVNQAVEAAEKPIPVKRHIITVGGEMK